MGGFDFGMLGGAAAGIGSFGAKLGLAGLQQKFSSDEAHKQRRFIRKMAETAWQRTMKDLEAAGLNPLLVAKLGPTPTGAAGIGATAPWGSALEGAANTGLSLYKAGAEKKVMEEGAKKSTTGQEYNRAITENARVTNRMLQTQAETLEFTKQKEAVAAQASQLELMIKQMDFDYIQGDPELRRARMIREALGDPAASAAWYMTERFKEKIPKGPTVPESYKPPWAQKDFKIEVGNEDMTRPPPILDVPELLRKIRDFKTTVRKRGRTRHRPAR